MGKRLIRAKLYLITMALLWKYLRPYYRLIFLSLLLAGISQLLNLIDPIIFGKIIDDYATKINSRPQQELMREVFFWLMVAVGIALLARVAKAF